ncbi:MAG: sigma-70 family RNA polymerase sigma factor [Deltaproteobacteria bacterium]|nr:sigma-70 family RNA polymerase sigma factor [Deltaproteobacteria bacterium]
MTLLSSPTAKPDAEPSDEALLAAYRGGDGQALDRLIRRYQKPVYRMLYRNVGNPADAEDLTQKAFLKALDHLPRLREDGAFKGWLFRIALNLTRNRRRSLGRWRQADPALLDRQADPSAGADLSLERQRQWEAVEAGLARLPKMQREVVRLRLHAEIPFREIAQILGSSEASCKVSYHHAVKKLRHTLAPEAEVTP